MPQLEDLGFEFRDFGKIARLNREIIITEKIDGTNAQILVRRMVDVSLDDLEKVPEAQRIYVEHENDAYLMIAGSRNRWLSIGDDNYGFCRWVNENANELVKLGAGRHFGEWWGAGIQRAYGLVGNDKRFSLFNVDRWTLDRPSCCHVVPKLYRGMLCDGINEEILNTLRSFGSVAAPGFKDPEGIVVFHTAANQLFKVTLEDDGRPKSMGRDTSELGGMEPGRAGGAPAPIKVVIPIDNNEADLLLNDLIQENPDKFLQAQMNPKLLGWFVGQVMKASGGGADAKHLVASMQRRLQLLAA